jgi:hypothetical protein
LTHVIFTAQANMWESSDWMLIQSQSRRVLPATSIKLGLGLTILNAVLWLIAMVLQVRQFTLSQSNYQFNPIIILLLIFELRKTFPVGFPA